MRQILSTLLVLVAFSDQAVAREPLSDESTPVAAPAQPAAQAPPAQVVPPPPPAPPPPVYTPVPPPPPGPQPIVIQPGTPEYYRLMGTDSRSRDAMRMSLAADPEYRSAQRMVLAGRIVPAVLAVAGEVMLLTSLICNFTCPTTAFGELTTGSNNAITGLLIAGISANILALGIGLPMYYIGSARMSSIENRYRRMYTPAFSLAPNMRNAGMNAAATWTF